MQQQQKTILYFITVKSTKVRATIYNQHELTRQLRTGKVYPVKAFFKKFSLFSVVCLLFMSLITYNYCIGIVEKLYHTHTHIPTLTTLPVLVCLFILCCQIIPLTDKVMSLRVPNEKGVDAHDCHYHTSLHCKSINLCKSCDIQGMLKLPLL